MQIRARGDDMSHIYKLFNYCPNCSSNLTILTWWQEGGSIKVFYRFCIDCHIEYAR